ncbi:hypothetical protein [Bradyrhizobium sp. WSM1417]|uniref:hypothetical protein n=1 Tax=Bradyrhizobium sp. WSM1417 TaxID=754500 RepID=UPI0004847342|nr:hypothetical protein [Bradyrhizobium sp. WSM1417]
MRRYLSGEDHDQRAYDFNDLKAEWVLQDLPESTPIAGRDDSNAIATANSQEMLAASVAARVLRDSKIDFLQMCVRFQAGKR